MNVEAQKSRVRVLVAASLAGLLFACKPGVPAPPSSLAETSPDSAFLRYGESLRFATDSPGVTTIRRVVNGVPTVLRVASEVRLPNTKDKDYVTGRIIARFETSGGPSSFGTPPGIAYLWVKAGATGHAGTLIFQDSATRDMGRIAVQQLHSPPLKVKSSIAECDEVNGGVPGDTIVVCCMCNGRLNCPFFSPSGPVSDEYVITKLRALGRIP